MEKAVIALKVKNDKAGIKICVKQACQLFLSAYKAGIEVADVIITFGGAKDILREIRSIDAISEVNTLILYSPSQICSTSDEFKAFTDAVYNTYKITIRTYRTNLGR